MAQLTWNHDSDRHEYQSDDWRWQIVMSVGGRYDVRDLVVRKWVAFGYTLEQAKEFCQTLNDDLLDQLMVEYLYGD